MEANIITTTEYYELIKESLQCKNFIGLVGKDITNVKFERKTFGNSHLNLNSVNFGDAKLTGADFSNCSLRGANFYGAVLHGVNSKGADLSGVTLKEY